MSAESASKAVPKPAFRLLFVDDEESILKSLRRLMRRYPEYECHFANGALCGLQILHEQPFDLIVSDLKMPGMDGVEFLSQVRKQWPFSVRFLLTGAGDLQSTVDALNEGGINRYIAKPWDDEELISAIEEGLRIRRLEREKKRLIDQSRAQARRLQEINNKLEARVAERTAEAEQQAERLKRAMRQLDRSYDAFVRVFSNVLSNQSHLMKGQATQVAKLSRSLAESLELSVTDIRYVYYAGLLHEIGKLTLPDDVLERSEYKLTHRDIRIYQRYPEMGETLLGSIAVLGPSAQLIRHHTEYFDGTGYPDGLREGEIPVGARILRVARDFVGLQSGLMVEDPLTAEQAFASMVKQSGRLYDPGILATLRSFVAGFAINLVGDHERRLRVSEVSVGMVLSRDLVSPGGLLLMTEGSAVTPSVIKRLQEMEVIEARQVQIYVQVEKTEQEAAESEAPLFEEDGQQAFKNEDA